MRIRSRNSITPQNGVWTTTRQEANGSTNIIDTGAFQAYSNGRYEYMLDEPLPTLRSAQRAGQFLVKPLEKLSYDRTLVLSGTDDASVYVTANGAFDSHTWGYCSSADAYLSGLMYPGVVRDSGVNYSADWLPFADPLGPTARKLWVLSRAYQKAADSDMQGLVSAAEFNKTLESAKELLRATTRLRNWYAANNALSALTRVMRMRRAANQWRFSKDVANLWLEWRYGVRMLYLDAMSAVKYAKAKGKGDYAICRSSWTDNATSSSETVVFRGRDLVRKREIIHRRVDTVSAGVIIKCAPATDWIRQAGLDKPWTSAWELVPYSWLVDRVIDVSGALAAFEGRYLRQPVASWLTHECQYTKNQIVSSENLRTQDGAWTYVGNHSTNASSVETVVHKKREANPRFLAPIIPEIKLRLNWAVAGDLIALIRQCLKS